MKGIQMNATVTMKPAQTEGQFTLNFGEDVAGTKLELTLTRIHQIDVPHEGVFHMFTRTDGKRRGKDVPVSIFKEKNDGTLRLAVKDEIKKVRRALQRVQQPFTTA